MRRGIGRKLVAAYSIIIGMLFFAMQTSKLFRPEAAEQEMAHMPFGLFDWGFVWADTLYAGPALIVGGILYLLRRGFFIHLGGLLLFSGFAINIYAMIFFFVGLNAVGQSMESSEIVMNLMFTILGIVCMVYVVVSGRESE